MTLHDIIKEAMPNADIQEDEYGTLIITPMDFDLSKWITRIE